MNFTLDWLSEFIDIALSPEEIAQKLTLAGLEVESCHHISDLDPLVCVAYVESVEKHPHADRLSICRVRVSQDCVLNIVCGAQNVRAGMYTACARENALLPSGLKIKKSKIRQIYSEGMLCSADELSLSWWFQREGILDLPVLDTFVGQPVSTALSFQQRTIYELSITPNRADCLSLLGIARELCFLHESAAFRCLTPHNLPFEPVVTKKRVSILVDDACFAYAGCVVKDINPSAILPFQIYQRLHLNGIAHKNAVVDILNYVMLHLGQPLHAFDLETIEGDISIRFPRPGEHVTLLNGVKVICDPDTLVIADEKKIIALAGVMGSLETAVTEKTRHIFIESACFSPDHIQGQARLYRLTSDAAYRFERGVDPMGVCTALEEAAHMILSSTGGHIEPFIQASGVAERRDLDKPVLVRLDRVCQLLGFEISPELFFSIMKRISEGRLLDPDGKEIAWLVSSPSYRYDLHIEQDYIEEVARFVGYDAIPCHAVGLPARCAKRGERYAQEIVCRRLLLMQGFQEVVSLSFCSQAQQQLLLPDASGVQIVNPIAQQYDVLRTDMSISLLGHLIHNLPHLNEHCFHCFEIGPIFENRDSRCVGEERALSLLSYGSFSTSSWSHSAVAADFFDLKGIVSLLLADYPDMRYQPAPHYTHLHPGKSAEIFCGDMMIGYIGELHPRFKTHYQLSYAPILASLLLERLPKRSRPTFTPFPRHPYVERDFAIIVDDTVAAGDVLSYLRHYPFQGTLTVELFDVFTGQGIPPKQKSLAFRLFFQHLHQNLDEESIHSFFRSLIEQVCQQFHGVLRGTVL